MKPLVRAYGEPLGRGVIRACIEDFVVTELYDFEPTGSGEHLLLWVEKRGANTGWVANQLASHFGLRHFDVSYCGKKDRHAVTRQWFSLWLPGNAQPDMSDLQIEGVQILTSTRHIRKLRRGEHTGNQFQLRVSGLELQDREALEQRLTLIASDGVPNYFGRQRFGRDGQNYEKAQALIADPEARSRRKLDRKQKDIYVSTLRAWLFNDVLAEAVASDSWRDDDSLWVYGLSPHRDITLPEVAEQHRAAAEFIEAIGIKAHERDRRIIPGNLTWQIHRDCLELGFSLPVGAYATTLLEELLEIEDAQS